MPVVDVFQSDFRLPTKVCVLAPGPNGKGHYSDIPPDFCVIAVSKAVLIPDVSADVWMMNHAHQDWFLEANARFDGVRVFSYDAAVQAGPQLAGKKNCYYFKPAKEKLDPNILRPPDGVIRYGASVTACAIQLAYNFGAGEILLCGADMSGDGYFDGTLNVQPTHGGMWGAVRMLNPLIEWMVKKKGFKISTLSPTRLDVPAYKPDA